MTTPTKWAARRTQLYLSICDRNFDILAISDALDAARRDALNEAAKVCADLRVVHPDTYIVGHMENKARMDCSFAILALIDKEPSK